MKVLRIEHIGIAMEEKSSIGRLMTDILGHKIYKTESVASEAVRTHFIGIDQTKIELLEATGEESAIAKFVNKKGPGVHHLAFEVENIHEAFDEIKEKGLRVLNEAPKKGADDKLIFFVHPKDTGGVLMEFCQSITND